MVYLLWEKDVAGPKWEFMKGEAVKKWGRLTPEDLDWIAGNRARLIDKIRVLYGTLVDEAIREVDDWMRNGNIPVQGEVDKPLTSKFWAGEVASDKLEFPQNVGGEHPGVHSPLKAAASKNKQDEKSEKELDEAVADRELLDQPQVAEYQAHRGDLTYSGMPTVRGVVIDPIAGQQRGDGRPESGEPKDPNKNLADKASTAGAPGFAEVDVGVAAGSTSKKKEEAREREQKLFKEAQTGNYGEETARMANTYVRGGLVGAGASASDAQVAGKVEGKEDADGKKSMSDKKGSKGGSGEIEKASGGKGEDAPKGKDTVTHGQHGHGGLFIDGRHLEEKKDEKGEKQPKSEMSEGEMKEEQKEGGSQPFEGAEKVIGSDDAKTTAAEVKQAEGGAVKGENYEFLDAGATVAAGKTSAEINKEKFAEDDEIAAPNIGHSGQAVPAEDAHAGAAQSKPAEDMDTKQDKVAEAKEARRSRRGQQQ